jgi:putative oxidoreductase
MVWKKFSILKIILIISSLFFGIAKLLVSPENTTDVFGNIGGSTSQYTVGIYQVVEGILLMFPATTFIGALMVAISMVVAILLHLFVIGFAGPFIVLIVIAIILLIISVKVMKQTRKDLFK